MAPQGGGAAWRPTSTAPVRTAQLLAAALAANFLESPAALAVSFGTSAHGRGALASAQEPLSVLGNSAALAGSYARSTSSFARLVAGEVVSRLNSEAADNAALAARYAEAQGELAGTYLRGSLSEVRSAETAAGTAAYRAEKAARDSQALSATLDVASATAAAKLVEESLAPAYKDFEDWKAKALAPPRQRPAPTANFTVVQAPVPTLEAQVQEVESLVAGVWQELPPEVRARLRSLSGRDGAAAAPGPSPRAPPAAPGAPARPTLVQQGHGTTQAP